MSSKEVDRRQKLIDQFVASFEKLDEMTAFEHDEIAYQLVQGETKEYGFRCWPARKIDTSPSMLEPIYSKIPARFPRLFEHLLLSYRWAEVDLADYRLLPNPLAPDLLGFFEQMSRDPGIWSALIPAGYLQFGKGADFDYDPVCFDFSSRRKDHDYRIVKIDHEEILCNSRVKVVCELAASFEELVSRTIDRASKYQSFGVPI